MSCKLKCQRRSGKSNPFRFTADPFRVQTSARKTTIFTDIRHTLNTPKQLERIPGIHFAEVLHADDTLLVFGAHARLINKLLQAVQQESRKYNVKLNMCKYINRTINRNQSSIIFFWTVPQFFGNHRARYLGATLTDSVDNHTEFIRRIGSVNAVASQLQFFWSKAGTAVKWRLRVFSKVLCGLETPLETMQLTKSEQNSIDR